MKPLPFQVTILAACGAAFLLAAPAWTGGGQSHAPRHGPKPGTNQNAQLTLNSPSFGPDLDKQAMAVENQQEIRLEVQRLYALATELKDEVDRTNSNMVLSLSVVKRAQDIEKLARQIKDRAKR
jgi:hypothetical protein